MKLTTKTLAARLRTFSEYLQHVGSRLFEEAFKTQGVKRLSIQQLRYLELIESGPGITPGELARAFAVRKPTVSNVIIQLQRSGLVSRTRSENDARVYRLFPTEGTRQIFQKRRGMYEKLAKHVEKRLDEGQMETLVFLMSAITKEGLENE